MAKMFAVLLGAIVLFGAAGSLRSSLSAQVTGMTVPMTGTVVNVSGQPVPGAQVLFVRNATTAFGGRSSGNLGIARTDESGHFSFGPVAVKSELAFPLENSLRLEYYVIRPNGQPFQLDNVTFTAPRNGSAIVSIAADIRVR